MQKYIHTQDKFCDLQITRINYDENDHKTIE